MAAAAEQNLELNIKKNQRVKQAKKILSTKCQSFDGARILLLDFRFDVSWSLTWLFFFFIFIFRLLFYIRLFLPSHTHIFCGFALDIISAVS